MNRLLVLALFASLAPAATIQGHVRDAQDHVVPNATVRLKNRRGDSIQITRCDKDGLYRLAAVPAGDYTIHAHAAGMDDTASTQFHIAANEAKTTDLTLKVSATLDFSDEPTFVVAGVTDGTYMGGHGPDAGVRSSESLAKATANLKTDAPASSAQDENAVRAAQHHALAATEEQSGHPLDAVREYQRAAELNPDETNLFDWGAELLAHSAPQAALEVFNRGINRFPLSSRMLLGAAVSLYAQGRDEEATKDFFAATDVNPSDPNPYLFLVKARIPDIAANNAYIDRLERFAHLQPANAEANYCYAVALRTRGSSNDSTVEALLKKATSIDPTLSAAWLQLGLLYSEEGNIQAAIEAYEKAIQTDPSQLEAHYRLAAAYRKSGRIQEAQHEAELFRQLEKTSTEQRQQQRSDLQRFIIQLQSPATPTQ